MQARKSPKVVAQPGLTPELELTPLVAAAMTPLNSCKLFSNRKRHDPLDALVSSEYGAADVERWFETADQMWTNQTAFPMLIRSKSDGSLLGGAGLQDIMLYGKREAELGTG